MKHILKASGTQEILSVVSGLPVNQNGFFLTEQQATAIDAALGAGETSLATANQQLQTATTERDTARTELATANTTITARDSEIVTLKADLAEARKQPAADIQQTSKIEDKTAGQEKVAFHNDPKNPINAFADKLMGAPVVKKDE